MAVKKKDLFKQAYIFKNESTWDSVFISVPHTCIMVHFKKSARVHPKLGIVVVRFQDSCHIFKKRCGLNLENVCGFCSF